MKKDRAADFDNFEMEPSMDVWKKIEEKLPVVSKKRNWFLLWIISGIVLVSGALQLLENRQNSFSFNDENNIKSATQKTNDNNKNMIASKPGNEQISMNNNSVIHEKTVGHNEIKRNIQITENRKKPVHERSLPVTVNNRIVETKSDNSLSATNNENDLKEREINSAGQEMTKVAVNNYLLAEANPVFVVEEKKPVIENKLMLTRWSLYAAAGFTYTKNKSAGANTGENNSDAQGVNNFTIGAGVSYDIDQRFKISLGISSLTLGLESDLPEAVYLHGTAGDPGKKYSFASPTGNLTGSGSDFDHAFYTSPDSSLFPHVFQATLLNDTVKTKYLNLREEFHYTQIPVMLTYKFTERKITPFVGMSFATSFLTKQNILLNGKNIYYENEITPAKYLFSTGLTVGAGILLSLRFTFFVDGFFMKGLNPVYGGDNKWTPDYSGWNGGIGYRL